MIKMIWDMMLTMIAMIYHFQIKIEQISLYIYKLYVYKSNHL
jgi:hypothetical protein